jgi:hypothetical protein
LSDPSRLSDKSGARSCPTVAPELADLGTVKEMLTVHEGLVRTVTSFLGATAWREIPHKARVGIFELIGKKRKPEEELLERMKKRVPHLDEFVLAARGAVWIEQILQGEVTEESLRREKERLYENLQLQHCPIELVEVFLKPYQRRPQSPPAKKRVLYLQALDYKRYHRETTWGQLALRFCKDKAMENTLKASVFAMRRGLAEVGIQVDLSNPSYSRSPAQR